MTKLEEIKVSAEAEEVRIRAAAQSQLSKSPESMLSKVNYLLDLIQKAKDMAQFYAANSRSQAKRMQVMDGGIKASKFLEELKK